MSKAAGDVTLGVAAASMAAADPQTTAAIGAKNTLISQIRPNSKSLNMQFIVLRIEGMMQCLT